MAALRRFPSGAPTACRAGHRFDPIFPRQETRIALQRDGRSQAAPIRESRSAPARNGHASGGNPPLAGTFRNRTMLPWGPCSERAPKSPAATDYRACGLLFFDQRIPHPVVMESRGRNASRMRHCRRVRMLERGVSPRDGRQAWPRSAASSSTSLNLIDSPQPQASATFGLRNLKPASSNETS